MKKKVKPTKKSAPEPIVETKPVVVVDPQAQFRKSVLGKMNLIVFLLFLCVLLFGYENWLFMNGVKSTLDASNDVLTANSEVMSNVQTEELSFKERIFNSIDSLEKKINNVTGNSTN